MTARSALRLRLWLSVWGLAWSVCGVVVFALAGGTGWALACGALALLVATDLLLVVRHIRQGPHYQPRRDVPPYEPPDGRPPQRPG